MDNKALLDELMGKDRDLPPALRSEKMKFNDPNVCHFFLAAFCPHDLFPNTKSDLGPCPKVHEESLRQEYLGSDKVRQYEGELLLYLERLIQDLERKMKRAQQRLDKEMPLDFAKANADRIAAISSEVQSLLKQAESAGEEGQVDSAQTIMERVEVLNKEKEQLIRGGVSAESVAFVMDKDRKMQVCSVCGAMQAACDTEKRMASHHDGKQHIGYQRIRDTIAELKKKRDERRVSKPSESGEADGKSGEAMDDLPPPPADLPKRGHFGDSGRYHRRHSREREDRGQYRGGRDSDRDRGGDRDLGSDRGVGDRERDRKYSRDSSRDRDRDLESPGDRRRDREGDAGRDRGRDFRRDERESGRYHRDRAGERYGRDGHGRSSYDNERERKRNRN